MYKHRLRTKVIKDLFYVASFMVIGHFIFILYISNLFLTIMTRNSLKKIVRQTKSKSRTNYIVIIINFFVLFSQKMKCYQKKNRKTHNL